MIEFSALLAAIDMRSLEAILAAIDRLPDMLPALQAWIEHAARWEVDRRHSFHYPLQGPMAILAPDELAAALGATTLICECFRRERRRDVSAVLAFFEGLRCALTAERERTALH